MQTHHIAALRRKLYQRLLLVRHLVRAGVPNLNILSINNCMIRPVLEFAAPASHSLLSDAQAGKLEKMQARAFKLIFG